MKIYFNMGFKKKIIFFLNPSLLIIFIRKVIESPFFLIPSLVLAIYLDYLNQTNRKFHIVENNTSIKLMIMKFLCKLELFIISIFFFNNIIIFENNEGYFNSLVYFLFFSGLRYRNY